MSKYSISSHHWFPIVALLISYAFLVGVFCLTIRSGATDKAGDTMKDLNNNLSIWICAIAATCTILPIVLGIKHNMDFENLRRYHEKEMEDSRLALDKEKEEMRQENIRVRCDYAKLGLRYSLTSIIMQVNTLCDLQDFQYKGGILLADNGFATRLLQAIDSSAERANALYCKYQDEFGDAVMGEIMEVVLSVLTAVRHLALIFLPLPVAPRDRFDVQGVADHLSLCLIDYASKKSQQTDDLKVVVRSALYELTAATSILYITMCKVLPQESPAPSPLTLNS